MAVATSYQNWMTAPGHERATAFAAYTAALDHEEDAAGAYQRLVEQLAAA